MDSTTVSSADQRKNNWAKGGTLIPRRKDRKVLGEITNTSQNTSKTQLTSLKRCTLVSKKIHIVPATKTSVKCISDSIRQVIQKIPVPNLCQALDQESRENAFNGRHQVNDVVDYSFDVNNYLLFLEKRHSVNANHLEGQAISPKNRVVLVDWIIQVSEHFILTSESFQLTVLLIDRYMSVKRDIQKSDFQLLGVAALFLATKYEEIKFLELEDLVHLCDGQFTEKDILCMERRILKAIDFRLGTPVPILFLRRFSKVAQVDSELHNCSKYLIELSLHQYELCPYEPSKIAAASSFISLCLNYGKRNDSLWDENLMSSSSYSLDDIIPVIRLVADSTVKASLRTTPNVIRKYAKPGYHSVSVKVSNCTKILLDLSSMEHPNL